MGRWGGLGKGEKTSAVNEEERAGEVIHSEDPETRRPGDPETAGREGGRGAQGTVSAPMQAGGETGPDTAGAGE